MCYKARPLLGQANVVKLYGETVSAEQRDEGQCMRIHLHFMVCLCRSSWGQNSIQRTWRLPLSCIFWYKPHITTWCGSLAFRPIWNSWHKAHRWVCELWVEVVKGTGGQEGVFFSFLFFWVTPLKRTPGKFRRLTAEEEPGTAKQEGECFHVFMCVFSFTTGTYIYMAAGLSLRASAECDGGSLRGVRTSQGDNLWNTLVILQGTMLLRCSPPPPFTSNVPNQWKVETQRVSLTLIWKKACLEWI